MFKEYRAVIAYLFIGGLTTLVNWCVHFPLRYFANLSGTLSAGIAWIIAVLFAFPTNKLFVYEKKDWKLSTTALEFLRFVSCRLFSGLLEVGILFLTDDILHLNGVLWKILASVIVVCLNYITGKLLVFRKN